PSYPPSFPTRRSSDLNFSSFRQFPGNGRRNVLTCALNNCSIVVNRYGNGLVLAGAALGYPTCNDVGVFFARIGSCSNDLYLTAIDRKSTRLNSSHRTI